MNSVRVLFSKCSPGGIKSNLCANFGFSAMRNFSSSSVLFSYTRKDITIPVPITGGYLAAQLWEKPTSSASSGSPPPTPMICMHGFQDASSSFDPLIPMIIKDGMTVVSVDLPGHGFSSRITGSGLDSGLDGIGTIHRVMRHFKWDKVTLLGHSYGAILSFLFTATYPDKVEKYIAIDAFHPIPTDPIWHLERTCRRLFEIEEKLVNPKKIQPSYNFEELVQRTYKGRKGTVTEEGVRILLRRGAKPDPVKQNMFKFTHDLKTNIPSLFGRIGQDECLALASKFKCPVCVIKGDPGEDYEPRENYMKMVDAVKKESGEKSEFHLVPGTHHLHLNDPNSVAPIISNFLDK